jgi:hypothetical protein
MKYCSRFLPFTLVLTLWYTSDILLLSENNDVTNLANTSTISSVPVFFVPVQIQPDSCTLHGASAFPQDLPPSAAPCATPGTQAPAVIDSADQNSTPRNVPPSHSAPVPGITDVALAPSRGRSTSSLGVVPASTHSDSTTPKAKCLLGSAYHLAWTYPPRRCYRDPLRLHLL